MVYRVYVEKKTELAGEARSALSDIRGLLGITSLENIRVLNRYDVENIEENLFDYCKKTVFSEPQLDIVTTELEEDGAYVFAVEYLPGQFDQRADSAAQCIQIMSCGERPLIRSAKVYMLGGNITDAELAEIVPPIARPFRELRVNVRRLQPFLPGFEDDLLPVPVTDHDAPRRIVRVLTFQ